MRYTTIRLAAAIAMMAPVTAFAAPTTEELWETIQKQQSQIEALMAQQQQTQDDVAETDKKIEATADAVENVTEAGGMAKRLEWASKTKIGGYGEHHYSNFDGKDAAVDAHRYVLYVSHEYSDTVRFFSEFELEHGVAGEGQPGEVELEQAYIEWDFSENHSVVMGQFLVPVGLLNETHEPDTFYGTERNSVEKNIIPTTWWETGAMIQGEIAPGLSYNVALHSGLENSSANIRSGRQKSAKATANDFAYTARLKYTAVPGLELASSYQYQEDISQGEFDDASASLLEAHAAYNVAGFGLKALWASWDVSGEEAEVSGRDTQSGFYVEPSYKINDKVGFFARYSSWDNTAGLSGSDATDVIDYGVNFWLLPNVVLKADFTDYDEGEGNDSLNLGVGWSF
ncbi:MAG: hypothetical protein ACI93R_000774 [Flavobacteriales bacterium]|jgi:hypothetical protein